VHGYLRMSPVRFASVLMGETAKRVPERFFASLIIKHGNSAGSGLQAPQ
jgi:hypothetical protein